MIKAAGTVRRADKLAKLVIFGLSHENLRRLKDNQPIIFAGDELGLPDTEIVIFSGETEASMARDLDTFIGEKTETNINQRKTDA